MSGKHGVTDEDRDLFIVLSNADDEMAERIMSDDAFTWEVYQITRYRQAAEQRIVAKIVAWLLDTYCSRDVIDVTRMTAAIKRGEWK